MESARIVGKSICRDCDQPVFLMEMPILGGPNKGELHRWKKGCLCDENLLAEEVKEIERRIKRKKLIKQYNSRSIISANLKNCTFSKYYATTKSQYEAKQRCKQISEQFVPEKGTNLLLYGSRGVGKSHLLYATGNVLMKRDYTVIFMETPEFLEKWIEIANGKTNESEEEFLDALCQCDVLIFDDFGAEDWTEWSKKKLLEIIEKRDGKSTWYSTRLLPSQLKERYGLEYLRALEIMEIQGKDYPKWSKQQYWRQQ